MEEVGTGTDWNLSGIIIQAGRQKAGRCPRLEKGRSKVVRETKVGRDWIIGGPPNG